MNFNYVLLLSLTFLLCFASSLSQAQKVIYPYVPACDDPEPCFYQKNYPNCGWDGDICDSGGVLAAEFRCAQVPANTSITFEYTVKVTPEPYFSDVSVPNGSGDTNDLFTVIAWRVRDKSNLSHMAMNIYNQNTEERKQQMIDNDEFCLNAPESDGNGGYTNTGCLETSRKVRTTGDAPITYTTGDSEETVYVSIIAEKNYSDMDCLSLMQTISIQETTP